MASSPGVYDIVRMSPATRFVPGTASPSDTRCFTRPLSLCATQLDLPTLPGHPRGPSISIAPPTT